jgi:hypothetical protein
MTGVTIPVLLRADSVDEAMNRIACTLTERDVPFEGRCGLVGSPIKPQRRYGIDWAYDPRLTSMLAVGWHRDAIIPPAIALRPEAIIYCKIGPASDVVVYA